MLRGKTVEILYHPALLSLLIWIGFSLVLPPLFPKYTVKTLSDEAISPNTYLLFSDLDNDGSSEKISIDLGDAEQTKVIVMKNDRILDQYNLAYHTTNIESIVFEDCNNDGFQEICVFTLTSNTINLSIIDPIASRSVLINNRFIDNWIQPSQSSDKPYFTPIEGTGNGSNNEVDFTFCISTGYSLQPRNLYRYLFAKDSLIKSPVSFATIQRCIVIEGEAGISDVTYLVSTQATGNTDDTASFSDQYAWLMVLGYDLRFKFSPVQIGEYPSSIHVIPLTLSGVIHYLAMYDYLGVKENQSSFYLFDHEGNIIKDKKISSIESNFSGVFMNEKDNFSSFFMLKKYESVVELLDTSLNAIRAITFPEVASAKPLAYIDADMDGNKEYFFLGGDRKSLVICQSDFKDAVHHPLNHEGAGARVSQVIKRNSKPMVHIQLVNRSWLISYGKNWFYYLKLPFYILLYFAIFLFIVIIYRIQKKRLELTSITEKKIASLQMKAIKNQLDPHFTLNVLNAIGSLYATDEKREKADYIFGKYARMIRQTVISSDQIIISLAEEIDFIKNYIDIERFRCDSRFNYEIDISPGINMQTKIPRMLIHSFVENSVKYGIRTRAEGGILRVAIRDNKTSILIFIEDNGPGIIQNGTSSNGTGKGLLIVNELVNLYYMLEKVRITISLENINQLDDYCSGTRASIEIFCGKT